jgi:sec-independent protein translocase protein TatA
MLNNIGPAGLILIAVVVLVLFGRGKIAGMMGEVGKGITAFKRGVKDSTEEIENASAQTAGDGSDARDVTPPVDAPRERDNA